MHASMQRLFGEFGHYSPWGRGKHTVASPSSAALLLRLLGGRAVLPQELTLSGNHLASLPEEVFKPLEGLNTLVPRLPHELGVCRLRRSACRRSSAGRWPNFGTIPSLCARHSGCSCGSKCTTFMHDFLVVTAAEITARQSVVSHGEHARQKLYSGSTMSFSHNTASLQFPVHFGGQCT